MTETVPKIVMSQCELLNRYYDERTLSSLPNGYEAFFQFGKLVWGYDLIEEIDGKPSCKPIPLDKDSIAGVFHESEATYVYIDGKIIITANIPAGALAGGDQHHFSCIGVKDNSDGLVLVAVTQPMWVYSNRGVMIEIVVTTARSEEAKLAVR